MSKVKLIYFLLFLVLFKPTDKPVKTLFDDLFDVLSHPLIIGCDIRFTQLIPNEK